MSGWNGEVRPAEAGDLVAVASLAGELAQSFAFSEERFRASYPSLLADHGARLLLAADGPEVIGYLLGFRHLTFYANGPVAWVEEVVVRPGDRGRGVGGALMSAFEQWAAGEECALVPPGGAVLPRRGVRGVRRLLPQGPGPAAAAVSAAGPARRQGQGARNSRGRAESAS
jgi:GNAT superfamily N-acetyltransferase